MVEVGRTSIRCPACRGPVDVPILVGEMAYEHLHIATSAERAVIRLRPDTDAIRAHLEVCPGPGGGEEARGAA